MKVFLTGGTGFIGKPLTRQLLKRGWQVTALVRNPESPQSRALVEMGAILVKGDVTDKESMRAGMTGADIAINNAGVYELGVTGREVKRMFEINVQGTENFLSLAKELNIPRAVHVSSIMYWGDTGSECRDETWVRESRPVSEYEKSKCEAHEIALSHQRDGAPIIIACPGTIVGANDHAAFGYFMRMYINYLLPGFAWSPNTITVFTEVNEVAEGIALSAEKGRLGETYLLTGEPFIRNKTLEIWASKPGGIRVLFWSPLWLTSLMFATLEPLQRLVGLPAFISRETARATSVQMNFSSQKAQRELGWTHSPAAKMLSEIVDQEIDLKKKRKKRDLISMLKPMDE